MPEPMAVDAAWVRRSMARLGPLIEAQQEDTGHVAEELAQEHILAAQSDLRQVTGIPFFVTRFVTAELAAQLSLVFDADYDEIIDATPYIIHDWRHMTGRLDLEHAPIRSVEKLRFTLANNNQVADIPDAWINTEQRGGSVHSMPYGSNVVYFNLTTLYPFYRPGIMAGGVPCLVHLRYTAGLVERTDYEVVDGSVHAFGRMLVTAYQQAIGQLAAARWMAQLGNALDAGGVSISVDGLSESVNAAVLQQRAEKMELAAFTWGRRTREQQRGPVMVFA